MLLGIVVRRCQIQEEAGCRGIDAAARLGSCRVASRAAVGLRGQTHRCLRRIHGSRANERALHPTQLHAPFEDKFHFIRCVIEEAIDRARGVIVTSILVLLGGFFLRNRSAILSHEKQNVVIYVKKTR